MMQALTLVWTVLHGVAVNLIKAINPYLVLSHVIGVGLHASLIHQGWDRRRVLRHVAVAEVVTVLLWLRLPDGWAAIVAIYVWIRLYERLLGPAASLQRNAVFVMSDEAFRVVEFSVGQGTCNSWNLDKTYGSRHHGDQSSLVLVETPLSYVDSWNTFFGKPPGKHGVAVDDVTNITEGADPNLGDTLKETSSNENACFVLMVDPCRTVTYIAESAAARDSWLDVLSRLVGKKLERYRRIWLEQLLRELDLSTSVWLAGQQQQQLQAAGVSLDEAMAVLERADRRTDKAYIREIFNTFARASIKGSTKQNRLKFAEFQKFFDLAIKRPEIQEVYDRLLYRKRGEVALSPTRFQEFMVTEQKECDVSLHMCKAWIREWEKVLPPQSLSLIGFTSFMLSEDQGLFRREHSHVYQDMDQPLSHYYIATSHNTYLTRDQLKGKSSVDAYISAFKRGCKAVELDIWDGPNNEPVIYHGHTLTSKILFRDVIQGINDYAFCVSDWPVILSFENHCSLEQQRVMASQLTDILSDKLYLSAAPDNETQLPSPHQLRGHIIIKGKKLVENMEEIDDFNDESDFDDSEDDLEQHEGQTGEEHLDVNSILDEKLRMSMSSERSMSITSEGSVSFISEKTDRSPSIASEKSLSSEYSRLSASYGDRDGDAEDVNGNETLPYHDDVICMDDKRRDSAIFKRLSSLKLGRKTSEKRKKKPVKIAKELSDLVVYCQAVRFKGFSHAKENYKHYQMSSMGEKKSGRFSREMAPQFIEFNRRQLSRIYPAGHRVDSSNYDPQPHWNVGCQMVALNYQTPCKSMQLNQGLFQVNGGCGYVLKPEFLRTDNSTFDPKAPCDENCIKYLMLRIISGTQLAHSKDEKVKAERSLHVVVRVSGVDADRAKQKTKNVKNNGYNPVWNDVLGFKLRVPELALLSITVREGDSFVGQYTLPFTSMQQGHRVVPLLSKESERLPYSSLFVHVDIKSAAVHTSDA